MTSAYDISLMSRELLNNHPSITNYTTIWMDSLRDGKSQLVNTNKLIRTYTGATGLKTGSTSLALYNLSASATRNDLSLIGVILKAPTGAIRFAEAKKLLDYGFANFSYTKLGSKGDVIKIEAVNKGIDKSIHHKIVIRKEILVAKMVDKPKGFTKINTNPTIKGIQLPIYPKAYPKEEILSIRSSVVTSTNIAS